MGSESTESQDVTASLPADLAEWLDERAAELDVDRDVVLEQLVAAYRQTADRDDDSPADVGPTAVDRDRIEAVVADVLAEEKPAIAEDVASAVGERFADSEAVEERIATAERNFQSKLQDVRERVVQVKRETDEKAPADHDHDAFERLDAIDDRLADIEAAMAALEAEIEAAPDADELAALQASLEALDGTTDTHDDRLADAEEKLRTVAWAVSDLRDTQQQRGTDTLERLKAAAAGHDVSRAVCQNCDNAVEIALLTRPACPHCNAAVTNVEPASGFFSKPALVVASQIEAGDTSGRDGDISATGQGDWR
ncbi:hypothetical protein [Halorhabdus sp. CUG00001]|uniref:hypothetical protein n=1 Tax=Halorhabdus sp. CUG00001 TaxID=2600297 RepID=UPI00131E46C4|nr:hypothetical protein [Halorhabdus sp. CUG00001]